MWDAQHRGFVIRLPPIEAATVEEPRRCTRRRRTRTSAGPSSTTPCSTPSSAGSTSAAMPVAGTAVQPTDMRVTDASFDRSSTRWRAPGFPRRPERDGGDFRRRDARGRRGRRRRGYRRTSLRPSGPRHRPARRLPQTAVGRFGRLRDGNTGAVKGEARSCAEEVYAFLPGTARTRGWSSATCERRLAFPRRGCEIGKRLARVATDGSTSWAAGTAGTGSTGRRAVRRGGRQRGREGGGAGRER